jgi:hypothetical protein
MIWDIVLTVIAMALVALGGWPLIRLLKARQTSNRSYGGENESGKGWTG